MRQTLMKKRDLAALRTLVIFVVVLGVGALLYFLAPMFLMGPVLGPSWRAQVAEMRQAIDAEELRNWASWVISEHQLVRTNDSIPMAVLPRSLAKVRLARSEVVVSIQQTGDANHRAVAIGWPGREVWYHLVVGPEALLLQTNEWRIRLADGIYYDCSGPASHR